MAGLKLPATTPTSGHTAWPACHQPLRSGVSELDKPEESAARGGCWCVSGSAHVHVGTERDFRPAQKAHPALVVDDIDAVERALTAAGHSCRFPENSVGPRHFHSHDPFGNRLEFRRPEVNVHELGVSRAGRIR